MQKWIISANGKMYDHAAAFAKYGYIDWRQRAKYSIGDEVYIYCTKPYQKIMYKTKVICESMQFDKCTDDREFWKDQGEYEKSKSGKYARLVLIEQADNESLSFSNLRKYGLAAAPQGPMKMKKQLSEYVDKYLKDNLVQGMFPECDIPDNCSEGAKSTVVVNKYERSSIARLKCIEKHGYRCKVCGLDFEEKYGELGKGFIHVHHIVPIATIGERYILNPEKDLIPVCPNCHAMLHRRIDGKVLTIDDLKRIVK